MARNNSALKAKMPKVKEHNKIAATESAFRQDSGDLRVLADIRVSTQHDDDVQARHGGRLFDNGALTEDDHENALVGLALLGHKYEKALQVPGKYADTVDPTEFAMVLEKNLKRAAVNGPRCALVDDVVIENYNGPSHFIKTEVVEYETDSGTKMTRRISTGYEEPVTIFYVGICKIVDASFRVTHDKETGEITGYVGAAHPAELMNRGVGAIVNKTARDLYVEKARLINKTESLDGLLEMTNGFADALVIDGLVPTKNPWASDVLITSADGTTRTVPAEDGFLSMPQRLRTAGIEYIETGSKRETRAAEDGALQMVSYMELLDLIKDQSLRTLAAFILFLRSQDSLRESTQETENWKGINKQKQFRNLTPAELVREWRRLAVMLPDGSVNVLPGLDETNSNIILTKENVRTTLRLLAEARDDYMDSMVGTEVQTLPYSYRATLTQLDDGEEPTEENPDGKQPLYRIGLDKMRGDRLMQTFYVTTREFTSEKARRLEEGVNALLKDGATFELVNHL